MNVLPSRSHSWKRTSCFFEESMSFTFPLVQNTMENSLPSFSFPLEQWETSSFFSSPFEPWKPFSLSLRMRWKTKYFFLVLSFWTLQNLFRFLLFRALRTISFFLFHLYRTLGNLSFTSRMEHWYFLSFLARNAAKPIILFFISCMELWISFLYYFSYWILKNPIPLFLA